MLWLQSFDHSALRLVRGTLHNPLFDWLMPLLSANILFFPVVAVAAILLAWKGGARGRLCLVMLGLVLLVGDTLICSTLKKIIGRPRPQDSELAANYGSPVEHQVSHSMPSSHAANWFSGTAVLFLYYRRSWRFMLPMALAVGYSRLYVGAHYLTDVLAGAALGVGYGAGIVWLCDALWQRAGRRWFPLWWSRLPSIRGPRETGAIETEALPSAVITEDGHWLRLGYALIGLLLFVRLVYEASGRIELGIDEAYQWVWSKHLALSYYSKPLMIAWAQRLGTTLFGDTAFGVRFASPVSAAVVSWLLLRFLAREVGARTGFWLVLISSATPLLAVGATVLTVDCQLVLFWTAAMVSGWQAVHRNSMRDWLWTGLWTGLGCLSKYTAFLLPLCWIIFFTLCKPARSQLRRAGPYVALALAALCTLPIWIWNAQHGWITLSHVANNAAVDRPWKPSLSYTLEFTAAEFGLLNPVFFVAALWAAAAFWRCKDRTDRQLVGQASHPPPGRLAREGNATGGTLGRAGETPAPLEISLYLFSMGGPLFLGYWLYTLHSRVQPNWIAASVLPLFCLMAVYWDARFRAGTRAVKGWLTAGISLGLAAVILLHDTNLVSKITRHPLPPGVDPLRQVRAWPETARTVGEARKDLLAEGRPVFIICGHYGMTGELSFYLPEAKSGVPDQPLVYFQSSDTPRNQFFFWPGYRQRKGDNALFVLETDSPQPLPGGLRGEFASVKDIGMREILYRGQVFRRLQLFECRDLQ